MYSNLIHKHSYVFKVKHDKNVLLQAPYIFVPILFENNISISDILRILVCDMVAMPGTLSPFVVRENLTGHS